MNEQRISPCNRQSDCQAMMHWSDCATNPRLQPAEDERVKEIRERWSAVYSFAKHRLHTAMLTHDGRPSRDSASLIHSAGADIDYLLSQLSQLSLQPAASTPTDLAAEMETVDSLLAKVSEARVWSDHPTYGEINECRKAIRRIVAATAASTEPVYGSGREFMLNSRFNDPVVSTETHKKLELKPNLSWCRSYDDAEAREADIRIRQCVSCVLCELSAMETCEHCGRGFCANHYVTHLAFRG